MRAFVALFLLLALCMGSLPAESSSKKAAAEKKLQKIQKELKESKKKLRKTKKEERAVLGRLAVIKKELKRTKRTLSRAQKKIKVNEVQVGALRSELHDKRGDLQAKEAKLKGRLREVYKSSGLNYLELLVSSCSMADFFNRLYFFRKIIEHDTTLVEGIRQDVRQVKQKKTTLERKTGEIRSLAKTVAGKKEHAYPDVAHTAISPRVHVQDGPMYPCIGARKSVALFGRRFSAHYRRPLMARIAD